MHSLEEPRSNHRYDLPYVMVWLSHSKFPQCLLSSLGGSLCCSSPECHLRLIKPAVYKTSVHNLPSPDCLLTHLFHDSHYNLAIVSLSRTLDSVILQTAGKTLSFLHPHLSASLPSLFLDHGSLIHWTHRGLVILLSPSRMTPPATK